MNKMKKGFTLVELLAVIVILAIILVIAVPKIMTTISDATKASFESSAKMVASQVENQYTVAQTLNKDFNSTGSCMEEWAGLNENDYASCTYEILEGGTAKVTLEGKNKFKNLWACEATRSSATAQEEECIITCKDDELGIVEYTPVIPYEIKDYDSCVSYLSKVCADDGAPQEFIDDFVPSVCNGDGYDGDTTQDILNWNVLDGFFTEEELIENNVIKGSRKNVCMPALPAECFDFEDGVITGYDETCGTDLVIPSQINGVDVVGIGETAFYKKGIKVVLIPNTVINIYMGAFVGNPLRKVQVNNPSTVIGCGAFGDISTIPEHNIPNLENYSREC